MSAELTRKITELLAGFTGPENQHQSDQTPDRRPTTSEEQIARIILDARICETVNILETFKSYDPTVHPTGFRAWLEAHYPQTHKSARVKRPAGMAGVNK